MTGRAPFPGPAASAIPRSRRLACNVARAILTYRIGPLRDEEERTGITLALAEYRPWWRVHQIAALLLIVATISGVYQLWTGLMTPVLVPTFGPG